MEHNNAVNESQHHVSGNRKIILVLAKSKITSFDVCSLPVANTTQDGMTAIPGFTHRRMGCVIKQLSDKAPLGQHIETDNLHGEFIHIYVAACRRNKH